MLNLNQHTHARSFIRSSGWQHTTCCFCTAMYKPTVLANICCTPLLGCQCCAAMYGKADYTFRKSLHCSSLCDGAHVLQERLSTHHLTCCWICHRQHTQSIPYNRYSCCLYVYIANLTCENSRSTVYTLHTLNNLVFLSIGSVGVSAQSRSHSWLTDAMEGPMFHCMSCARVQHYLSCQLQHFLQVLVVFVSGRS